MRGAELSPKDQAKFKAIYWENVYSEKEFMDQHIDYIKSKGFNNTKEYMDYHEERERREFKKWLKDIKKFKKEYNRGDYDYLKRR